MSTIEQSEASAGEIIADRTAPLTLRLDAQATALVERFGHFGEIGHLGDRTLLDALSDRWTVPDHAAGGLELFDLDSLNDLARSWTTREGYIDAQYGMDAPYVVPVEPLTPLGLDAGQVRSRSRRPAKAPLTPVATRAARQVARRSPAASTQPASKAPSTAAPAPRISAFDRSETPALVTPVESAPIIELDPVALDAQTAPVAEAHDGQPAVSTGAPTPAAQRARRTSTPARAATPTRPTATPARSAATPTRSAATPTRSAATPTRSAATPTRSAATSTRPAATAVRAPMRPRERWRAVGETALTPYPAAMGRAGAVEIGLLRFPDARAILGGPRAGLVVGPPNVDLMPVGVGMAPAARGAQRMLDALADRLVPERPEPVETVLMSTPVDEGAAGLPSPAGVTRAGRWQTISGDRRAFALPRPIASAGSTPADDRPGLGERLLSAAADIEDRLAPAPSPTRSDPYAPERPGELVEPMATAPKTDSTAVPSAPRETTTRQTTTSSPIASSLAPPSPTVTPGPVAGPSPIDAPRARAPEGTVAPASIATSLSTVERPTTAGVRFDMGARPVSGMASPQGESPRIHRGADSPATPRGPRSFEPLVPAATGAFVRPTPRLGAHAWMLDAVDPSPSPTVVADRSAPGTIGLASARLADRVVASVGGDPAAPAHRPLGPARTVVEPSIGGTGIALLEEAESLATGLTAISAERRRAAREPAPIESTLVAPVADGTTTPPTAQPSSVRDAEPVAVSDPTQAAGPAPKSQPSAAAAPTGRDTPTTASTAIPEVQPISASRDAMSAATIESADTARIVVEPSAVEAPAPPVEARAPHTGETRSTAADPDVSYGPEIVAPPTEVPDAPARAGDVGRAAADWAVWLGARLGGAESGAAAPVVASIAARIEERLLSAATPGLVSALRRFEAAREPTAGLAAWRAVVAEADLGDAALVVPVADRVVSGVPGADVQPRALTRPGRTPNRPTTPTTRATTTAQRVRPEPAFTPDGRPAARTRVAMAPDSPTVFERRMGRTVSASIASDRPIGRRGAPGSRATATRGPRAGGRQWTLDPTGQQWVVPVGPSTTTFQSVSGVDRIGDGSGRGSIVPAAASLDIVDRVEAAAFVTRRRAAIEAIAERISAAVEATGITDSGRPEMATASEDAILVAPEGERRATPRPDAPGFSRQAERAAEVGSVTREAERFSRVLGRPGALGAVARSMAARIEAQPALTTRGGTRPTTGSGPSAAMADAAHVAGASTPASSRGRSRTPGASSGRRAVPSSMDPRALVESDTSATSARMSDRLAHLWKAATTPPTEAGGAAGAFAEAGAARVVVTPAGGRAERIDAESGAMSGTPLGRAGDRAIRAFEQVRASSASGAPAVGRPKVPTEVGALLVTAGADALGGKLFGDRGPLTVTPPAGAGRVFIETRGQAAGAEPLRSTGDSAAPAVEKNEEARHRNADQIEGDLSPEELDELAEHVLEVLRREMEFDASRFGEDEFD